MSDSEFIQQVRDIVFNIHPSYPSHEKYADIAYALQRYDNQKIKNQLLENLNLQPECS